MNNIVSKDQDIWIRPWMAETFDDLYNRDERFFAIIIKGALGWLTNNIVLYNKSIKHFVFNTGSSYLYVEANGYNFDWAETTGEDTIYHHMPRCVVEIGGLDIPIEELTQPFVRGVYERRSGTELKGYNAEIRRLPIEMTLTLKYVLSNFNESIILLQELIDKLIFMKYFTVVYLGQRIQCSLEFPGSHQIEINKIDMTSAETNQKNINIELKLCANYPIINTRSEISNSVVISSFGANIKAVNADDKVTDTADYTVE